MFKKVEYTKYPPQEKPLLVYDGKCGFCKYWVIKWKVMTKGRIDYCSFQDCAANFPDIDVEHFREAVRCILPDGRVFGGPEAAYYTSFYSDKFPFLFRWYQKYNLFQKMNDLAYQWVADNRDFVFRICIKLLGKNPRKTSSNWKYLLLGMAGLLSILIYFCSTNT